MIDEFRTLADEYVSRLVSKSLNDSELQLITLKQLTAEQLAHEQTRNKLVCALELLSDANVNADGWEEFPEIRQSIIDFLNENDYQVKERTE